MKIIGGLFMEKVESFELDHRKVKAPYIRKCCVLEGAKGESNKV